MAITIVHHRQAVLKRPAYHRLTFDDRITIQAGLQSNPPLSVRAIAAQIGVSHSTVSREITRHRVAFGVQEPRYSAAGAHGRALVMQAHKEHRRKRLDDPGCGRMSSMRSMTNIRRSRSPVGSVVSFLIGRICM
nr:helix-turn-helix domain-containing protein [Brevibacterium casei]